MLRSPRRAGNQIAVQTDGKTSSQFVSHLHNPSACSIERNANMSPQSNFDFEVTFESNYNKERKLEDEFQHPTNSSGQYEIDTKINEVNIVQ